jgi:divinyl protochlorophyllide a 8-vinyl-reductase
MPSAAAIVTQSGPVGRIGPNAITRVAEALGAVEGAQLVHRVFRAAGLERYVGNSPSQMIDEAEVACLHRAVRDALGDNRARTVGWIAGQRTADYLLRHRIPHSAQMVIRSLPSGPASRLLAAAIARNAWTFVGTGTFAARHGGPTTFTVGNCPICRRQKSAAPCCDFYAATFERLFSRLVHARARVAETSCLAMGAPDCTFAIEW